jgi:hypothetical protein
VVLKLLEAIDLEMSCNLTAAGLNDLREAILIKVCEDAA